MVTSRRTGQRFPRALTSAIAAALLLTACGGGSKGGGGGGTTPVQGGTLVRAINYGDPGNLDPILATDVSPEMVVRNLFSRLLAYDPVDRKFEGDLATEWNETPDHMTWEFTLRKGAKFTNGREINASDVKYSFERLIDPKNASPAGGVLIDVVGAEDFRAGKATSVQGIETDGDSKVTFRFRAPFPTLSQTVAQASTSIVPKEEVEKAGAEFGRKPVGSGPFVLASWTPDDRLVLEANPNYYGGRPHLDGVTFRIMKDEATRDADFRSGTLDMVTLAEDTYQEYKKDPTYSKNILEVPELFTRAIFFNTTVKPFDDVRVRQAVNLAVNKKLVVEKALANKAFPAVGPLQESSPGFDKDLKGYGYDPDQARKLLADAGLEGGFEMEVLASASGARAMEALIGDLKAVGITLKIVQVESPPPLARGGNFKTAYYSTGGDVDPISFLYARFHSRNVGAAGNVARYANPEVDKLLDQGNAASDIEERARFAREAQRIVVKDAPWFFFNYNKAAIVHKPQVHGLQPVPTDIDFQDLTKVWLEKPE
jgi:peptide/nickel transport system substrate-binding protein